MTRLSALIFTFGFAGLHYGLTTIPTNPLTWLSWIFVVLGCVLGVGALCVRDW